MESVRVPARPPVGAASPPVHKEEAATAPSPSTPPPLPTSTARKEAATATLDDTTPLPDQDTSSLPLPPPSSYHHSLDYPSSHAGRPLTSTSSARHERDYFSSFPPSTSSPPQDGQDGHAYSHHNHQPDISTSDEAASRVEHGYSHTDEEDEEYYDEDIDSWSDYGNSDDADMAGRGRRPNGPQRRQTDITGFLTLEEKNDLSMLINNITDKIMKQIAKVFDSPPVSPTDDDLPPQRTWIPSFLQKKENKAPAHASEVGTSSTHALGAHASTKPGSATILALASPVQQPVASPSSKSYSRAHAIIEKEENEAMTPQLSELKKEALAFYSKWRAAIMGRVRDLKVSEQAQMTYPGRGGSIRGGRGNSLRGGRGGMQPLRGRGGARGGRLTVRTPGAPSTVEVDPDLLRRFPPTPTPLFSLDLDKRKLILHTILLLCLGLETYSAYSRVLLLNLASSLHVSMHTFQVDEVRVARGLGQSVVNIDVDEILREKAEQNKTSRRIKVGLAGVAGAALIGVTGGLAAPLVAAGIGTVLGGLGLGATAAAGLLGTMAESGLVVGSLFGIYGARASAKSIESYTKDVQDFALLPLHGQHREEYIDAKQIRPEDRRLRLVIGISGWLTQREDIIDPWRCLGHQAEVYALRWEVNNLLSMGTSLETVIKSTAWSVAKKEIITRTIFASLMQAMWPLGLLKISKLIDNPWSVGMVRAEKVGYILADALIRKVQGERPVSLIGYSLAARAIYACLMVLAERRQFGLVDSVVLIGAPVPSESRVWLALKSVVAGRLVNVYSQNDYILGFLYRTSSIQFGVAGLQAIQGADGVENCDVSDVVSGHLRYQYMIGSILKKIKWEDINLDEIAQEEQTLALIDEKYETDRIAPQKSEIVDGQNSVDWSDDQDAKLERPEREQMAKQERQNGKRGDPQKNLVKQMGKLKV